MIVTIEIKQKTFLIAFGLSIITWLFISGLRKIKNEFVSSFKVYEITLLTSFNKTKINGDI